MWNPKLLKTIKPKQIGLDAIDMEAEAQGNARSFMRRNEVGPKVIGRRIGRESRAADGAMKTADFRATKNLVKDTAEVARRVIVG